MRLTGFTYGRNSMAGIWMIYLPCKMRLQKKINTTMQVKLTEGEQASEIKAICDWLSINLRGFPRDRALILSQLLMEP